MDNKQIIDAKQGDLLKPFLDGDKFVIVKVLAKNDAKPLTYEKALADVKVSYINVAKAKKLDEKANKELENFIGTEVKSLTRQSVSKIKGLQPQEAANFLNQLFSTTLKTGTIKINDKVVLFRINSSKLGSYDKSQDETVKNTLVQLQSEELMINLVKRLENKYEVQSSIEIKE